MSRPWSNWAYLGLCPETYNLVCGTVGRRVMKKSAEWRWRGPRADMSGLRGAAVLSSSRTCAHMNTHTYTICSACLHNCTLVMRWHFPHLAFLVVSHLCEESRKNGCTFWNPHFNNNGPHPSCHCLSCWVFFLPLVLEQHVFACMSACLVLRQQRKFQSECRRM